MKIALMSPAGAMHRYDGSFSLALHYAPLTLTTLAALVPTELEADITLYDETIQFLPTEPDVDLIGMTAITGTSRRVYRWADYYRSLGIPVVLGGVHPTLMPDEAARHADAVVTGYAEDTWPQLLRDFAAGRMRPRYDMAPDFQLGGRPTAERHRLPRHRYITRNVVEATRGCLHDCSFCVVPAAWGRRLHTRPVAEVAAEVEALPGRDVIFIDLNLIANPAYAKALFRELAPLNKRWYGLSTSLVDRDPELFRLLVESGCRGLLIGFEAVGAQSLAAINKGFNHSTDYAALMAKLHDNGIAVNGTFVFGTDGDDRSVFERTVEMVHRLKIDLPRYAVMTPFPGSGLFRQLEAAGRIRERDWSLFDVEHCVIEPAHMSPSELEAGLEWAWQASYTLADMHHRAPSPGDGLLRHWLTNMGYRRYARMLPRFTEAVMCDHSDVPEPLGGERAVPAREGFQHA